MNASRARKRATLITAALVGAVSLQIATGDTANAVNGPAVTDGALAFSVKVSVGDVRACSGALLTPWWLVTAKSCFADGTGTVPTGAPAVATTATVGRLDLTKTTGYALGVDKVVPHPDRDLAVARLAQPADGVPTVPVATTAPAVDSALLALGYGRTADTWVPDQLHAGDFKVTSVAAGTLGITAVSSATICKGDAGGPAVVQTASGPQLVGVHASSEQGGCLAEAATGRNAVETRLDDIAPWITANTAAPRSLQLSLTGTRIGLLNGDYGAQVKDGGLSAGWVNVLANAKQVVLADDRVGVLTRDDVAYVKEGGLSAAWVKEYSGVKQLALSANRIGVLTHDGVAYVKEGGLSAAWVKENTGIRQLAVTDTRVGVLTNEGAALVKEGGLSAGWVTEHPGVTQLALSGDRIGVVLADGSAKVKSGGLSAGWVSQAPAGIAALVLDGDRVGVLTTDKVAKVKAGALSSAFVTEHGDIRHLSLGATRIGVVTLDGAAKVKDGGLSAAWTTVWS